MKGLAAAVAMVLVGVVLFALVARSLGAHVNLGWTLLLSLGLTVILNLLIRALR